MNEFLQDVNHMFVLGIQLKIVPLKKFGGKNKRRFIRRARK